jgi:uncharacterized membrane-anchored protein YitT (DUF2179 family)
VLDWRGELAKLRPLSRQLVWMHGAFIVLVIVAFGVLSLALAGPLADGTPLARGVCGFVAAFWLVRLGVQFFVFDAAPFLNTPLLRVGYHGLTVTFTVLVLVYGWAAVAPAALN